MLKITFLRNMLLLSLLLVTIVPLYDLFYIYPSYSNLLTEETEDEAVRFVNYLVRTLHLEDQPLTPDIISAEFDHETAVLMGDALLIKLRVFSPAGEIIYSTIADDLGKVNKNPYFHQIVARGRVYSKVVKKDRLTAEGQRTAMDVVETYVPVMTSKGFGGAMEVYYDITNNRARVGQLTQRSTLMLVGLSLSMFLVVLVLLTKAKRFWIEREHAEAELQKNHAILEERVQNRTGQLLQANQQLTEEIAERALAQIALKSSMEEIEAAKEKIDGILKSVADGLLVVDQQQRVMLMNQPAEEALGVSFKVAANHPLFESLAETERWTGFRSWLATPTETGSFDFQGPTTTAGVGERVYQGRCSPLRNRDGQIVGQIVMMQDVSREREIERLKSEFLAMAAHELHTPITTIMGYTELLATHSQDAFSEEQRREFTGYIHDKATALAHMVDDLLDVSRIEAGQPLLLQRSRIAVADVVASATQLLPLSPQHRLMIDIEPRSLEWFADQFRLEQLLGNLLNNAVKYSPEGGEIRLAARVKEDQLLVTVSDQGMGMTPAETEHVFERFFRADNSNTAVAGTGLGMSIARIIVEAHGGEIWIDSQKGVGTRVSFTLAAGADGD
jgi:signal transduction histidine kinase